MQNVIVIHASSRACAPTLQAALLDALPYARRLELERRAASDRSASLGALALVLIASARLYGRPVSIRDLVFPVDGKPWLRGGPSFSVAHSESRVACAVTSSPDIGLDVEDVPEEGEASAQRAKLERWTATEAALKAAGLGLRAVGYVTLDQRLQRAVVGDRSFVLSRLDLAPASVCHLAASGPVLVAVEAVSLDDPVVSVLLELSLGLPSQFA